MNVIFRSTNGKGDSVELMNFGCNHSIKSGLDFWNDQWQTTFSAPNEMVVKLPIRHLGYSYNSYNELGEIWGILLSIAHTARG